MASPFDDLPAIEPAEPPRFDDLPVGSIAGEDFDRLTATLPASVKQKAFLQRLKFQTEDSPIARMPRISGQTIADAGATVGNFLTSLGSVADEGPREDRGRSPVDYFQDLQSQQSKPAPRAANVAAGAVEGGKAVAEGIYQNPALLVGAELPVVGRALGGYFAYEGATKALPQEYQAYKEAKYAGDEERADEAIGKIGFDTLFTALGAAQLGKSGLANEVPGLRNALVNKAVRDYSPAELRDIGRRVQSGDATAAEVNLVGQFKRAFEGVERPNEAVEFAGARVASETPRVSAPWLNEWLGIRPETAIGVAYRPVNRTPLGEAEAGAGAPPAPEPPVAGPVPRTRAERAAQLRQIWAGEEVTTQVPNEIPTSETGGVVSEAAAAPVAPAEVQTPIAEAQVEKPVKERTNHSYYREFRQAVINNANEMGWFPEDFAYDAGLAATREKLGSNIKAKIQQNAAAQAVVRRAMNELGVDTGASVDYKAALAKLNERVALAQKRVPFNADDLRVGDEFADLGEPIQIRAVDPGTMEVTAVSLKSGRRMKFGEGSVVKMDPGSLKRVEVAAPTLNQQIEGNKALRESIAKDLADVKAARAGQSVPIIRPGERGTAELFQGGDQPFNLAGERGVDFERASREQAEAERQAAEAKAAQEGLQEPLFSESVVELPNGVKFQYERIANPKHAREFVDLKAAMARSNDLRGYAASVRPVVPDLSDPSVSSRMGLAPGTWGAIQQAFGARVQFFDPGVGFPVDAFVTSAVPDVIFMNVRSLRPFWTLTWHELLHHLRRTDPGLYDELAGAMSPLMSGLQRYAQLKTERYRARGLEVPPEEAWKEELIADFLGDKAQDPGFWNELADKAPELFQRLAQAVVDFLTRLLDRIVGFGSSQYFTDLAKARNVVTDALAKFARNQAAGKYRPKAQAKPEFDFSLADIESVQTAKDMSRFLNEPSAQRQLVEALRYLPNEALVGPLAEAWRNLPEPVRALMPEVDERFALIQQYAPPGSQVPSAMEAARQMFPNDVNAQLTVMGAVLANAERLRATGVTLDKAVGETVVELQQILKRIGRTNAAKVEADAAANLADEIIVNAQDALDQRLKGERNAVEQAGLTNMRQLVQHHLGTSEHMQRIVTAASRMGTPLIQALARDIKNPATTVRDIRAKYPIFNTVSDEVAEVALGTMRLNADIYDQLITAKNARNPGLQADLKKLDQVALAEPFDVRKVAEEYGALKSKSDAHAKLARAVKREFDTAFRRYIKQLSARNWVDQAMQTPQFQENYADAARAGGVTGVIRKGDTGLEITWENPNVEGEKKPEITVQVSPMTAAEADVNNRKLETLAGWMQEYIDTGSDPLLKAAYEKDLEYINQMLRSPENNPRTGNRLARGFADVFSIAQAAGLSVPEAIGRYLGGELGARVRRAIRNYSDARGLALRRWKPLSLDVEQRVKAAAKSHDMTIEEWIERVNDPVLESYMAIGDRHFGNGSSIPGGIVVNQTDMAALKAQKRLFDALAGGVVELAKTMPGYKFAQSKIRVTPGKGAKGERVYYRDPLPMTELGLPRRFRPAAEKMAKDWTDAVKELPAAARDEALARMIDDPNNRRMMLSYFRTFSDPSFAVKSPLADSALVVERQIEGGSEPADFEEWVTRLQEAEAQKSPANLMSREAVRAQVLKDLTEVMSLVHADKLERDVSAQAPQVSVIDTQNFMNRPRGDTIGLKGMYDIGLVTRGQQIQLASSSAQVYGQEMLNSLRAAQEALVQKYNELEAQVKATGDRPGVSKASEEARGRGDEMYALGELGTLITQLQKLINEFGNLQNQTATYEQQMMTPRVVRAARVAVLPGLLQRVSVMANNLFGGVSKLNQMDLALGLAPDVAGIESGAVKNPVSWGKNILRAGKNTVNVVLDALSKAALGNQKMQQALVQLKANPELFNHLTSALLHGMERRQQRFDLMDELGLYNYEPFIEQIKTRWALRSEGGQITGTRTGPWMKQVDRLLNAWELFWETGFFALRAPSAWLPGAVDAAINLTSYEKTVEAIGTLQLNILKAFRTRVAAGENPMNIRLSAKEILGPGMSDKNLIHLRQWFDENGMDLDELARQYYLNVEAAPPAQRGQVWMLNKYQRNALAGSVASEINRATYANRPQNFAGTTLGRTLMLLMGYAINENAKGGLMYAKAARNPKKLAEIRNAANFFIPALLMILALGTLVSAPLIDKMLEAWEKKKRPRPGLADIESPADALAVLGYASGPLLPMAGQLANNFIQPGAPGRGFLGSGMQLLPMTLAQSVKDYVRQMIDTGDVVRPSVQFMNQWNPNSRAVTARTGFMEGVAAAQNDMAAQRKHTPAGMEMRKSTGGTMQYSSTWGQVQDVKNEIGKQQIDWANVDAARNEAIAKLRKEGKADPERSFDASVLASANKYMAVYGRELTPAEKAKIDAKKTPEELAESNRIDANVQAYASRYGRPVPDFVSFGKRGGEGSGGATVRAERVSTPAGSVEGVSIGGGGGGGLSVGRISRGRSSRRRLSGGLRSRRIFAGPRGSRMRGLRAPSRARTFRASRFANRTRRLRSIA